MTKWQNEADEQAKEALLQDAAMEVIVAQVRKRHAINLYQDKLDEFVDQYVHDFVIDDMQITPHQACDILVQLADHKETDNGLWQGLELLEQLKSCAIFTYRAAIAHYVRDRIRKLNEQLDDLDDVADEQLDDLDDVADVQQFVTDRI